MSVLVARFATLHHLWLLFLAVLASIVILGPVRQIVALNQQTPDLVLADFYQAEQHEQREFRFSRATSHILLPKAPQQPAQLVFRVLSLPSLPTRDLSLMYGQSTVATVPVTATPRRVHMLLPASPAAYEHGFLVSLKSKTASVPGEARKLGFMFEDIHLESFTTNRGGFGLGFALLAFGAVLAGVTGYSTAKDSLQRAVARYKAWPNTSCSIIVVAFCCIYVFTFAYLSIAKHQLFLTNAYDLGIYDQTLWLISHGKTPYNTTMGIHILGNHGSFLVYVLSLLYLVAPDVRSLLILQSVAIALGGWFIYCIGRDKQHAYAGAIIALLYLLHPSPENMNLFDFHPDAVASAAIIAAFWLAQRQRWMLMFIACAIVMASKEHFALTILAFGIYLLLHKKYYPGLIVVISSIAWFAFVTQIIQPAYNGLGRPVHLDRYGMYGSGITGILTSLVTEPHIFFDQLFQYNNLLYLCYLTLPFVCICWFDLRTMFVAAPILVLNMLTDYQQQTDLRFHYAALIVPVVAIASLNVLIFALNRLRNQHIAVVAYSVCALIAMSYARDTISSEANRIVDFANAQSTHLLGYDYVISLVKPQAKISVQSRIQPHISHGEQVFLFPSPFVTDSLVDVDDMPFTPDVEYILYDSKFRLSPYMDDDVVQNILSDTYKQQRYTTVVNLDGVMLLKRADLP